MSQSGTSFDNWLSEADLDDEEAAPFKRSGKRRVALLVGALVILLVVVGVGVLARGRLSTNTAPQYRFGSITSGDLTTTVSATGPVGSQAIYNLSFQTSAKLIELDVTVGQQVQTGQLLARIDTTALQDALNQAEASLNSAQVNYNNALTNYNDVLAQNSPCPTTATPPSAAKTQSQCTQAINQAKASLNSAQAQVQSADVQVQTAQDNLKNGGLVAPASGTIVAINGAVGTTTGPSTSSPLLVLEDLNHLAIVAQVNEADIGSVKVGQSARFTVAAYPGSTLRGSVTALSLVGQTTSNVVTYNVTVAVDQNSLNGVQLLPGMTASLNITTAQRIGVLLVPNTAISFARSLLTSGQLDRTQVRNLLASATQTTADGQAPQGTPNIVAELQNGKLTPKVIFVGLSSGALSEVLAGLTEGEQVLTGQINATTTTTSGGNIFGGGGGGRGGNGGG